MITALILRAWIGVSCLPADLMDKTDGPCKNNNKPLWLQQADFNTTELHSNVFWQQYIGYFSKTLNGQNDQGHSCSRE